MTEARAKRTTKARPVVGMRLAVPANMPAAVKTVLLLLLFHSSARAEWRSILPGPADRIVATANYAAVRRGGQIWIFGDDGTVMGRMARQGAAGSKTDGRAVQREAEEILDILDVAELDREEDWALDLVYDERTLAQRNRARARASSLQRRPETPATMAARGGHIWIAGDEELIRLDSDGSVFRQRRRLVGGKGLLAADSWLAVVRTDGLLLEPTYSETPRFLPVPAQATHVALSKSGQRWAYAVASGITWEGNDSGTETYTPESRPLELRYCGEDLVALFAESLLVVPEGAKPEIRSQGQGIRRLFCPEGDDTPWLAVGEQLRISFDQGRAWQEIDIPTGITISEIAATAHHLWIASNQGVFLSHDDSRAISPPAAAAKTNSARRQSIRRAGSWLSWLPKLSVRATAFLTPAERRFEAMAFATIPLDPRRLPILSTDVASPSEATTAPPKPPTPRVVLDLHDPDRDCLVLARQKAIEVAMAEPERARSYVTRAGRAAWLPELRMLVSRRYGRSESLDIASSSTALSSPLGIDTVNDIRYEARATWDLAKLVFASEELAAQNQALHMAELRRDIESTVNRLYYERRRLLLDLAGTPGGGRTVRVGEIEAELDSLSSGAFGLCAGERVQHR